MGVENLASESAWQKRYDAAHSALEDAPELAQHQRLITQCDPAAPPTAHIFTTVEALSRARRVCLLTGSFNPLTVAHVALAEAAREVARLELIIWACTAITIDKEGVARASLSDRLQQLGAYVTSRTPSGGDLHTLLNRGLYVDQASAIHPLLRSDAELFILVGFDKIVQIFDPAYYTDRTAALDTLFSQAHLLVAPRAGAGKVELEALLARPENAPYADHVQFVPVPPEYAEDSSTEARRLAAQGDEASIAALLRLVTPEGMAQVATGAYAPATSTGEVTALDVDDTRDAYLWRQVWVRALARTRSPVFWRGVPPLSTLVTYTLMRDRRGEQIRRVLLAALTAPTEDVSRLLRTALAKLR